MLSQGFEPSEDWTDLKLWEIGIFSTSLEMAKYGSSGTPWTSGTVLDLAGYDTSSKSTLVKSE